MSDDEYTSDFDEQIDAVRLGLLTYEGTHCIHGTFVGNWAGPDYMCGPCEMGVTDEEWAEQKRYAAEAVAHKKAAMETFRQLVAAGDNEAIIAWISSEEGAWLYR